MIDQPTQDFKNHVILCYHRVTDHIGSINTFPDDGLSISSTKFENQIKFIKKKYSLFDLKANKQLCNNKKKLLITFDDGYKDIIDIVLPIIERHNTPIVVFITTGPIINSNEFCWWIDLWNNLKNIDEISIKSKIISKVYNLETRINKMKCYKDLSSLLLNMKREEQIIFFIDNGLKTNYIKDFLTLKDLKYLSTHPLVTLGFHSNHHLNYKIESKETISKDLESMFNFFETNSLTPKLKLFAFCYGLFPKNFCYNDQSIRFDYFFSLGVKSLFSNTPFKLMSRININGHDNFRILKFKIKLFFILNKLIRFITPVK